MSAAESNASSTAAGHPDVKGAPVRVGRHRQRSRLATLMDRVWACQAGHSRADEPIWPYRPTSSSSQIRLAAAPSCTSRQVHPARPAQASSMATRNGWRALSGRTAWRDFATPCSACRPHVQTHGQGTDADGQPSRRGRQRRGHYRSRSEDPASVRGRRTPCWSKLDRPMSPIATSVKPLATHHTADSRLASSWTAPITRRRPEAIARAGGREWTPDARRR